MSPEKLVLKNAVVATIGRGLDALFAFVFFVWFSRMFGKETLGKYWFAMSLAGLLCVVIGLGLNNLMVREVSRDKSQSRRYVGTLLVTQGVLALLIWAVIWALAWISPFDVETKWILGLSGTYHVLLRIALIFNASFRAHEEMEFSASLLVLHRVVILAIGIPVMLIWNDPILTIAAYPIGTLVMSVSGFVIYRAKYGSPDLRIDLRATKKAVVAGGPFFAMMFLVQLHDRVGVLLLGFFKSDAEIGDFAAAGRILATVAMVFQIFGDALMPALSRLSVESRELARGLYRRSLLVTLIVACPLALLFGLFAERIILLTFDETYGASIEILRVLSVSLVFISINQTFLGFLVAEYHEKALAWIRAGVVGLHVLLSIVLISQFSTIGLAYAKVVSMGSLSVACCWFVVTRVKRTAS